MDAWMDAWMEAEMDAGMDGEMDNVISAVSAQWSSGWLSSSIPDTSTWPFLMHKLNLLAVSDLAGISIYSGILGNPSPCLPPGLPPAAVPLPPSLLMN